MSSMPFNSLFILFFKYWKFMTHILKFVEGEWCCSSLISFFKNKVHIHLTSHWQLVATMYAQQPIVHTSWQLFVCNYLWDVGKCSKEQKVKTNMNDLCNICLMLSFRDWKKFHMLPIFWRNRFLINTLWTHVSH
jgi:hypothetical protein